MMGELLRTPAQAYQRYHQRAFDAAGYQGLRPAHMSILIHIDHPPAGTRITELADRAQMTKQSMGELVSDFEAAGYVERIPDPSDGRAKIVRLTPAGWDMHEAAGPIARRLEAIWADRLGEQDFAELRRLLKKLVAILEE